MKTMKSESQTGKGESAESGRAAAFETVRHLLGRLAHHVRAPKQIIDDFSLLEDMFQRYFVRQVPALPNIPRPTPDNLTTLVSILKRMLPEGHSALPKYETALLNLDQKVQIHKRVLNQYQSPSFQPKVHAEIQVLEYFYENTLYFAGGDRYISCSKPSCYCCYLYIRNHPLDVVEPASHKNLYLNWGLPLLNGGVDDPNFKHQRNLLNKMLETIRREALDQISRQRIGPKVHPDSLTGITPSLSTVSNVELHATGSLDEQFLRLSIGET